jgi:DUF971 family protein
LTILAFSVHNRSVLTPKAISTVENPEGIKIQWEDGSEQVLSFKTLRLECPCALCKGERTPFDPQVLPMAPRLTEQSIQAQEMFKVGTYAIGFRWGDGHDSGIYTFEYLKDLS